MSTAMCASVFVSVAVDAAVNAREGARGGVSVVAGCAAAAEAYGRERAAQVTIPT